MLPDEPEPPPDEPEPLLDGVEGAAGAAGAAGALAAGVAPLLPPPLLADLLLLELYKSVYQPPPLRMKLPPEICRLAVFS